MSMTCQLCEQRYALVDPQRTVTGERLFVCLACAAQQPVPPRRFPEGTQRTNVKCEHSFAYECAHCGERRCWTCNELSDCEDIKTAVKWCPAHERLGKLGQLPFRPAPDRAERERAEQAHQLELAQGKVAVLLTMLKKMIESFPELNYGLTSAAQQQVLRDVRAVLEESK